MQPLTKKKLTRIGLAVAIGLASSCLAMALVNTVGWLGHVELQISPNQGIATSPQIVVVSQTKDTLDKLGEVDSEPDAALPRRFHAELIRTLAKGGAKVVLMDYDFSEKRNEEENQLVRGAVEQVAPTVVILGQVPHSGQQIAQGAEPTITFKVSFVKPSIEPPQRSFWFAHSLQSRPFNSRFLYPRFRSSYDAGIPSCGGLGSTRK